MYVYILSSEKHPERFYVGLTEDLERRLTEHNNGQCSSTYKHRPWFVQVSLQFRDDRKAAEFEAYLKTGSGRAFANRHFSSFISP